MSGERAVWKYQMQGPSSTFDMPKGAQLLCTQMQGEVPTLWALVDPAAAREERRFVLVPTGILVEQLELEWYVGTVQMGWLVFHVFEQAEVEQR